MDALLYPSIVLRKYQVLDKGKLVKPILEAWAAGAMTYAEMRAELGYTGANVDEVISEWKADRKALGMPEDRLTAPPQSRRMAVTVLTTATKKRMTTTMAKAKFECIFATDEPFRGFDLGYDEDKGFHLRTWEARLPMSSDMIFADIGTPSGIQVLFGHNPYRQSVGRVVSASFANGQMRGVIELNEKDLESAIAGGFEALAAGVNIGLSAGFVFLDNPPMTVEKGEGTKEKPDIRKYGQMDWIEISLTAIPRLKQAGIVRRIGEPDPTPNADEGDLDDGD